MKLSEFYSKNEEDVTTWYEKMKRVAIVNNWKDNHIYTIVAVYLKKAATDYYKKKWANVNR